MTKEIDPIESKAKPHSKEMAKQELEKKNDAIERPNKKEVIITVYVESPSPSPGTSHPKTDRFKKIKPNPSSRRPHQTVKKGGYDRRAHLLAYSQNLRSTSDPQRVQWPKTGSKPKIKMGSKRVRTPLRLRRTQSRWRYQRLVPEVDISCNDRKKKATGSKTNSNFLKKLRSVLRGISGCSKGSEVAEKNIAF